MYRLAKKIVFAPQIFNTSSFEQLKLVRMMSALVKNQAFINGQWVDGVDKKKFKVTNPANSEVVGEVPDMTADDAKFAIDKAYETFHSKAWQNTTAKERSTMLKVR
jgi:delta 1-pyrroline-5-carboxylate dehydrogenase